MTTDNFLASGTGTGRSGNGQSSASGSDGSGTWAALSGVGVDPRAGDPELGGPSGHMPRRGRMRAALVTVLAALVGACVLGGVAFAYNATKQPAYTSESLVIVLAEGGSTGDVSPITAAWVKIGDAPLILAGAAREVGVDASQIRGALTVSQPDSTPLVSITVTTNDARRSATWANAVAEQLLTQAAVQPIPGFSLKQLTTAVPAQQADRGMGAALILGAAFIGALAGGVVGRHGVRRFSVGTEAVTPRAMVPNQVPER